MAGEEHILSSWRTHLISGISDLHLLHGSVVEMEKGDILGHEFCGVVESTGSAVSKVKVGDRVVASFQIACGDCTYCKKKLSSQCERTNSNTIEAGMYGGHTAGQLPIGSMLVTPFNFTSQTRYVWI